MSSIEINNLTKEFGYLKAVDSVSLDIKKGELFGLLGPNGAGKTTLISMLATLLKPTSGSAKVSGSDIEKEMDNVRKSIGIVFQDPSLDFELTGRENMDLHGRMYGMNKEIMEKRINELLKLVELEDKADIIVKNYSGGMKRRLEIARGLMHKPKILFLDEPTLGLDPQTRRRIWEHIKKLNEKEDITVILTTHYMEEADFLCDRIGIIDQGKIIALDTPNRLKNIIGGDVICVKSSHDEKFKKALEKERWVKKVQIVDGEIDMSVNEGEKAIPKILNIAQKIKVEIHSVNLKKPTLEDVFIHYTGRTIRDESADSIGIKRQRMRIAGH